LLIVVAVSGWTAKQTGVLASGSVHADALVVPTSHAAATQASVMPATAIPDAAYDMIDDAAEPTSLSAIDPILPASASLTDTLASLIDADPAQRRRRKN
jgi:hypothetical protein